MVEDLSVAEVAVEGEITGNVLIDHPIDQFFAEERVVLERLVVSETGVLLAEATKLQGIVFARSADVVGNQVVMGDEVALVSMVPEPAGVLNQLATVVDQGVVDCDDAVFGVAGGGVTLQLVQPTLVEGFGLPLDLSERAVQAGLVGGNGKLTIDAADSFAFSDEQTSQVLGEVAAFWSIGEQVTILGQEVLDDSRKLDDGRHSSS